LFEFGTNKQKRGENCASRPQRLTGPQIVEPAERRMCARKTSAGAEFQRLLNSCRVCLRTGGVERRDGWVVDSSC